MFGQNDNASMVKGVLLFDCVERLPKQLYSFGMVEEVLAVIGDDGEEVSCSGRFGTVAVHSDGRSNLPLELTDGAVIEHLCVGFSGGNPTYGEGRSHSV